MLDHAFRQQALAALRDAYQTCRVTTLDDAQQVVSAAVQVSPGRPVDNHVISELTAYCHRRLLREGLLKRSCYGVRYILKDEKPLLFVAR